MKIVMTAGGGGHFSPLLSVFEKLPKEDTILVVGRKHTFEGDKALSFEYQTATRLGMHFETITTARLQRRFSLHTIPSLIKLPQGFFQAYRLLHEFRPDVVLSFGGYVSFPVVVAAWFLRIPIVIHEQTFEAGAANKMAAFFAKKICVSWKSSEKFFPKEKVVLTGNPIKEFKMPTSQRGKQNSEFRIENEEKLPIIYITGGSGGAHAINTLVEGCIEDLLASCMVIHQTGDAKQYEDFERLEKLRKNLPDKLQKRYMLAKFFNAEEVGAIFQKADLVVSRAGISTVTELLVFGIPSLLIPLPFSQRHEQQKNALYVQKMGLGEVANQQTLTSNHLLTLIQTMLKKKKEYRAHGVDAKKEIFPDAQDRIITVVKSVL